MIYQDFYINIFLIKLFIKIYIYLIFFIINGFFNKFFILLLIKIKFVILIMKIDINNKKIYYWLNISGFTKNKMNKIAKSQFLLIISLILMMVEFFVK